MATPFGGNRAARDAVLERVRQALGKTGERSAARVDAQCYIDAHAQGPRPLRESNLVTRFVARASDMESTVEHLATRNDIPAAVARYLDGLPASTALAAAPSHAGVCWPEFADLDWRRSGLAIEARPTLGADRLGITGCFCGIAETGTLMVLTGPRSPTATALLPDTHVAILPAERIVAGMEDAFALVRHERGQLPRAVNMISGPSRTGDIEQTIVLGAHGPFRVHILILG